MANVQAPPTWTVEDLAQACGVSLERVIAETLDQEEVVCFFARDLLVRWRDSGPGPFPSAANAAKHHFRLASLTPGPRQHATATSVDDQLLGLRSDDAQALTRQNSVSVQDVVSPWRGAEARAEVLDQAGRTTRVLVRRTDVRVLTDVVSKIREALGAAPPTGSPAVDNGPIAQLGEGEAFHVGETLPNGGRANKLVAAVDVWAKVVRPMLLRDEKPTKKVMVEWLAAHHPVLTSAERRAVASIALPTRLKSGGAPRTPNKTPVR